ncbi:uncharacterized protein LOC132952410 isoform X2 [Metopolophium dirhodum]|uniref:uncharacterized protein LOC132952410 isoform X2 n=1 Tax=Metopolophium dirhodum TaxID=44670 RepID=UPI0029905CC0|nr:uncharacterized protein LOC132952410 isoform X2 [Metopolophium dirhodum]
MMCSRQSVDISTRCDHIGNVICLMTADTDFSRIHVNLATRPDQPTSCPSSAMPGSTALRLNRRRHLFRLNIWTSKKVVIAGLDERTGTEMA